jgi:hypothetical protein
LKPEVPLVIVVVTFGRRSIELTRRANLAFARIGSLKPGRHVPVQMVYGVRVFGVGLALFAGEDLILLFEPSLSEGPNLRSVARTGSGGLNALV